MAMATKAQRLAAEIDALGERKSGALSGGEIAKLQTKLAELGAQMLEKRNAYLASTFNDLQTRLFDARQQLN